MPSFRLLTSAIVAASILRSDALARADDGTSADRPRPPTHVDSSGLCVVDDPNADVADARRACNAALIPRRPSLYLETPGAFFVGYAWGARASHVVYGPQVGIGAAILFPITMPALDYVAAPADGVGAKFARPAEMAFALDLAVSLNANLAAITSVRSGDGSSTAQGFNASVFIAPQLAGVWWSDGHEKRVALSVGLVAGYLKTEPTGPAVVIGVQPAIVALF